jgi:hypothetical protein
MTLTRIALALVLGSAILGLGFGISMPATPALADDDESVIEDTYVAPLDLNT